MTPLPLYARLLGPSFQLLPSLLSEYLCHPRPAGWSGIFHVSRGGSWASRLVAALLRMPPSGEAMPTRLVVRVGGDLPPGQERWERCFGAAVYRSSQWEQGGELVEWAAGVRVRLALSWDDGQVVFTHRGTGLGLRDVYLPLPRWAAPHIQAWVRPAGDGVETWVCIRAPGVGVVSEYRGVLKEERDGSGADLAGDPGPVGGR